jgi:hypothetical protein
VSLSRERTRATRETERRETESRAECRCAESVRLRVWSVENTPLPQNAGHVLPAAAWYCARLHNSSPATIMHLFARARAKSEKTQR